MDSDLDIARAAKPAAIEIIAKQLNLDRSDLILQGPYIAKISWKALQKNILCN